MISPRILPLLFLAVAWPGAIQAAPVISEFMAASTAGLIDEDGATADWIELHNPAATDLNLADYALTDNAAKPLKWPFPAGVNLPAGGYLVVFASGKDRRVPGANLHTNFSLSSSGEYLGLHRISAPSPAVSAYAPTFPAQRDNVSYGLLDVGHGPQAVFFTTPSPNQPNLPADAPAEMVEFSLSSRTFPVGNPLSVGLSTLSATAVIRYTLTNSEPTATPVSVGSVTASTTALTRNLHGLSNGDAVQLSSTGTLPGGLSPNTDYFVVNAAQNSFGLAVSVDGAALTFSNVGSGVISVMRSASAIYNGTPLSLSTSRRVRARAYEMGRPDGLVRSNAYLALDAEAQNFTSPLPIMILHDWGVGHPSSTLPTGSAPEDTKVATWFTFEPQPTDHLARLTNLPALATPGYFERRGSSTFSAAKYSLTLGALDEAGQGQKVGPLGLSANDDFVLNSPYQYDRSLLHNDLIYALSNACGRWAPQTRQVEIFLSVADGVVNGAVPAATSLTTNSVDYYGVYSFQDKVSRGSQRVDVESLEPTDNVAPAVQGGYLWKLDRRDLGDVGFTAAGRTAGAGQVGWTWVTPKENTSYPSHSPVVTAAQTTYLAGQLDGMYAALQAENFMHPTLGYAAWLDVPAAIDHHLLNTAAKSLDAFRLSGFWHKARYGKLVMGPIFDFDRAMGSTDTRDLLPSTWRGDTVDLGTDFFHSSLAVFTPNYFDYLFRDPNFWQAWIDRLQALRAGPLATAQVLGKIDSLAETLDPGNAVATPAKRNFTRWTSVASYEPRAAATATPGTDGTFRGEVAWLKYWWSTRLGFMDGQFTRPAQASVASGPVPVGTTVTLSTPSANSTIYYTTDGSDPRLPATAPEPLVGGSIVTTPLVAEHNPVRAIVPTAALDTAYGTAWRGVSFDDSTWYSASPAAGALSGVGYDDSISVGVNFLPFIALRFYSANQSTNTNPVPLPAVANATMRNVNATCYVRYPFTLTAATAAQLAGGKLLLNVRYDDGFVAFLNGTEIKRSTTVGAATTLAWNTVLAAAQNDPAAIIYEEADVSSFANLLHAGANVLAFQMMNGASSGSALNSSDALLQAKLTLSAYVPTPSTPAVHSAAQAASSALTITQPTAIFARAVSAWSASDPPTTNGGGTGSVPNGSSWSAPTWLYYFPGAERATPVNIVISEVSYHPPAPSAQEVAAGFIHANDFEFIRITNRGVLPVDLTGCYFSNGLTFTAAPGLQNWLPAGQSVVVVENGAAFTSRYGRSFTVLGQFSGELDDGGEHLVLNDATGAIIADFTYGDSAPWPAGTDGQRSLVYVSGNQNEASSWTASLDAGGTGVQSYAAFQQRHFPRANTSLADRAPMADPDLDGFPNLLEYALGQDPLRADPGLVVEASGGSATLVIRRRAAAGTDLSYEFQASADLQQWTPGTAASILPNADGSETCRFPAPPDQGKWSLRLQATVP